VLLLGAGLLMRTFVNIQRVDPGFEPRGVLTMRLTLPRERYPGEAANTFFDSLVERLSADSRVRAVSAASQFPPLSMLDTQFALERPMADSPGIPIALSTVVTPTHFEALRAPMHSGRTFSVADNLTAPLVAIVNQTFVSRFMGGVDPIGQRIMIGSPQRPRPWTTIVGVVADFRNRSMTQATRPEIYTPMRQQTAWSQLFVLVRGDGEAAALLPTVRDVIRTLDPEQPIYNVVTLQEAVAQSSFQQRLATLLLSLFAGVALVLAAVGIFGVLSYMVSARTSEIGVRLAVGAEPRHVKWMVVGHVLRLTVSGLLIGTAVLLAAGKAIE
jgi:predicted permease